MPRVVPFRCKQCGKTYTGGRCPCRCKGKSKRRRSRAGQGGRHGYRYGGLAFTLTPNPSPSGQPSNRYADIGGEGEGSRIQIDYERNEDSGES